MSRDVFEFDDYKEYLNSALDDPNRGGGRGARARLSNAIQCQTAYTAQVLRGHAHFSLEHAEAINVFLGHSEDEGKFFLLLVQIARAGTPLLRSRFLREVQQIRETRLLLKNRLGVQQTLKHEDQVIYYSSWYYAALHVLASIPSFQTTIALSKRLGIDLQKAKEGLDFLVRAGILSEASKTYKLGTARIHLGADSPLISKHHVNWRLQAIRAIDAPRPDALHYSSTVSLSSADAAKIRETLVKVIGSIKTVVRDSPEEVARCLNIDFFEI